MEPDLKDDKVWPELGTENSAKSSQATQSYKDVAVVATSSLASVPTRFKRCGNWVNFEFREAGRNLEGGAVDTGKAALDFRNQSYPKCEHSNIHPSQDKLNKIRRPNDRIGKFTSRRRQSRLIRIKSGYLTMHLHPNAYMDDVCERFSAWQQCEAVSRDINTIDMDTLKITSESEIDMDNMKQMSNLSIRNDDKEPVKFSRNFREYCTNTLTKSLNENLEKFLGELRRLQGRLYERSAQKGRYRRRYYCGIKEVQKRVELNKVKFLVIAPDLEKVELSGGLDDQVNALLESCRKLDVVVCFALRRRKLGYHMHGRGFVGCVGVANYGGLENVDGQMCMNDVFRKELFKNVLVELVKAKNDINKRNGQPDKVVDLDNLVPEDYLLSESIRHLMKVLTSIS